ncbi:Methyltransf_11 domain-containing protein [Gammaproteobacteria bacterium]
MNQSEENSKNKNLESNFAERSNYKLTWQKLAQSSDDAKMAVAGHTSESDFDRSALLTISMLEKFVGINPTDIILEIGCGVGRVGKLLSPRCTKWIGTDISSNMLKYTEERLKELNNIELVELLNVGLKEIPDNSIDLVYCTVVFMHLYEWDRYRYVQESFRVLKPGGRCFFDNIDITSDYGWNFFMDSFAYPIDQRPARIGMISTGDELKVYGEKAGFENVKVHRWHNAWVGLTGTKANV